MSKSEDFCSLNVYPIYLPIFESGHVSRLYFIHGWQSSRGANWEHQQAERLGIEVVYLEPLAVNLLGRAVDKKGVYYKK